MPAGRPALPPRPILLAAALVAALLAIPYVVTRVATPGPGHVFVQAPYAVHDWLVYVSLVQQPWTEGWSFLGNPFTTEPQSGRIVLLPLQVLNALHHATGLSGFTLLELSRPPLIFLFVLALWSFLSRVFPGERERRWAAWLVLLSGGWEFVATTAVTALPPGLAGVVRNDLWYLFGWSTFAAAYNPLWLAGFSLLLVFLGRALAPEAPDGRGAALVGAVLVVLFFTHPYSALAGGAMVAAAWLAEWLLAGRPPWRGRGPLLVALAVAAVVIAAGAAWQRADPVFRASSASFFGKKAASPFWYPLTFAALLAFGVRGLALWARARHPWRFAIGGALVAGVLLSSSDLVNGYHFIPYLHLPLCVVAAPAVAETWEQLRGGLARAALVVALFAAAAGNAFLGVRQARDAELPTALVAAVERLGTLPPGNVLAPPWVGNLVPALTPHRVLVGHYFMTPDYEARSAAVDAILADPAARAGELRRLVTEQRIDYCLVRAGQAPRLAAALGAASAGGVTIGDWAILLVRREGTADAPAR